MLSGASLYSIMMILCRVEKGEILEVKLQANKDSKAVRWELVGVFTDRSMKLKEVVEEVRKRQKNLGPDTVRFG